MSIILSSDGYKYSQWLQYPPGTEYIYSYIESRGGEWDKTIFFGLQGFIKEYLLTAITQRDIDEAEKVIHAYGLPFYRKGWEYILKKHEGFLPVEIKAVDEGTPVLTKNVLVDVINTDPECYWVTSFLETALLRAVWYPTTVATNSFISKMIIHEALVKSGDPSTLEYKLHDFGARGVSSQESARIGGAAHLVNFRGSDTVEAISWIHNNYNCVNPTTSIPASEHSTITSWGKENEVDAYRNMVKQFGKPGSIFACVSDSYDIFNACKLWGTELKEDVINSGATLVVRPDSGDPAKVVLECLLILESYFGSEVNIKGYKVLNHVRIIQGDGIDHESIKKILLVIMNAGFSADNVNFGQGGALLQKVDRDTLKWAMKCSAAKIKGKWIDVYKDPITDPGKVSKKGRLKLIKDFRLGFRTISEHDPEYKEAENCLTTVFKNGILYKDTDFEEIRYRASRAFSS